MSESFICTWVSTERWRDWHTDWNGLDTKLAKWMRAGKQICCLSYVGHTHNPLKDDCYFCYASARLMNLIWQGGSGRIYQDPECNILYQIETGRQARQREDGHRKAAPPPPVRPRVPFRAGPAGRTAVRHRVRADDRNEAGPWQGPLHC